MKNRKRIAAILAAAAMSFYSLPMAIWAEDTPVQDPDLPSYSENTGTDSGYADGDKDGNNITGNAEDISGSDKTTDDTDISEIVDGGTGNDVTEDVNDGQDAETSDNEGISPASLLPIEEHYYENVTIDRTMGTPEGLTEYSYYVKEALGDILLKYGVITDKEQCDKVIMYSDDNDNYVQVEWNDVITPERIYSSLPPYTYAYFIVGNGDQLSMENTRYRVTLNFNTFNYKFIDDLAIDIYNDNGEILDPIDEDIYNATNVSGEKFLSIYYDLSVTQVGENKFPGVLIGVPEGYSTESVRIYDGLIFNKDELASAKDITSEIINDGTDKTPCQLSNPYDDIYTYCYKNITLAIKGSDGSEVLIPLQIYVRINYNYISVSSDSGSDGYIYDPDNGISFQGDCVFYGKNSFDNVDAYISAKYYDYENNNGESKPEAVTFSCFGNYSSKDDAKAAGEQDITRELFYNSVKVDFSRFNEDIKSTLYGGTAVTVRKIDVTAFDINDNVCHDSYYFAICEEEITTSVYHSPSDDTYFNIQGAKADDAYLNYYKMPSSDDNYYKNGYQTIFILDRSSPVVNGTTIYPTFTVSNGAIAHRSDNQDLQYSGESPVTFNTPETVVKYYVTSESGKHLKDYWVTFITQQEGAHLFVNATNVSEHYSTSGTPRREIFLNDSNDFTHDIFIANTGTETLTGITATLSSDTVGVKLDPYWQITENSTGILNPFDSTYYGKVDNIAKIRLIPEDKDNFIPISGTLTISSANGGSYNIELSGTAGIPRITTDTLFDGVKYVPYSCFIGTNNMYETDAMKFTISGDLPEGLSFNANTGEIYGVPKEFGVFPITVSATYTGSVPTDGGNYTSTFSYELVIKDNEDANVDEVNTDEQGEKLTKRIDKYLTIYYNGRNGNYPAAIDRIETENGGLLRYEIFESQGKYNEDFMYFYLDGEPLAEGQEFNAVNGSTVITLNNQTFMGLPIENNSRHTLAAEFREGKDTNKKLTRSAQNVYLKYVNIGNDSEEENNNTPSKTPTSINPTVNYNNPANGTSSGAVNVTTAVTDKNGNAVSGLSLELHSKVLKAKTNADGTASFSNVDFGRHTLYAKDQNGKTLAKKEFTIKSGNKTEISGNIITAKAGETVYLAVQYDDSTLTILNVAAEDVSAAAGIESKTESIGTLYGVKENFALVIIAMLISFAAITASLMIDGKHNK